MTDATKRAAGLKTIGNVYTGLLYVTQLWKLYVNIAVVTDGADAAGVLSNFARKPEQNPQAVRLADFENDNAIHALNQAGLDANVPAMHSALPAARRAYELHATRLDRWITSIGQGAFLSKKVIQVADIAMIAISIYQVWKLPAVSGGSPTPPTILGTLPGGVAVGSTVSLASLARAVEAIRRLVAIGALDGAIIAGIGSLGGGPSIALPELQRPTSLSVQTPGGSAGKPPAVGAGVEAAEAGSANAVTGAGPVIPRSGPIPSSVGAMSRAEAMARKLGLNAQSPTTRQVLNSLDMPVKDFVGQFRQGSIKSRLPSEVMDMTVGDALQHNSTVRKLLIDGRFVK
ncbi:MAG: hypothetical protein HUU21_33460 [Polyangiaceae bacterium]|nr:hypothetical protein [Polyangiaceae bacterium]